MRTEWLRSLRKCVAALFVLVALPALLIQLVLWLWHPMFYNQFLMHDGLPFLHWWPEVPYCDSRGNLAKADFHRNLLVVFLTANSKVESSQFCFPRSVQGGVAFPSQLQEADKTQFVVPKSTDRLFVFGADGTRREFPLASGEAERIFKLMGPTQPPDLTELLERAYAEGHSPASFGTLREAIVTLQAKEN
ncbi:MAG: hypothetical protein ACYC4U_25590 [Pirellulaceae bacterium]